MPIAAAGVLSSRKLRPLIPLIGKSALTIAGCPEMTRRVADTASLPVDTTEKVQACVFD
jgi:hypothetical protein